MLHNCTVEQFVLDYICELFAQFDSSFLLNMRLQYLSSASFYSNSSLEHFYNIFKSLYSYVTYAVRTYTVGPALCVCICHIHHLQPYTAYTGLWGQLCVSVYAIYTIYSHIHHIQPYAAYTGLWGQLCGSVYAICTIYIRRNPPPLFPLTNVEIGGKINDVL